MCAEAFEERAAEGVTARGRWLAQTGGHRCESGGMAWSGQAGLACEAKQLVSAGSLAEGCTLGVRRGWRRLVGAYGWARVGQHNPALQSTPLRFPPLRFGSLRGAPERGRYAGIGGKVEG